MKISRKNDLSLRLLEVFGAMMTHQTTVQAAEDLGISQPAVSLAIRQLEEQLGFQLFERRNRRLVPTQEARILFTEIEPIFLNLRSLETRVRDLREGRSGVLRVLATPPLGHSVMPLALKRFLKTRQGVSVQFDIRRMENVIEAVEAGTVDFAFLLGMQSHPGIDVTVMKVTPMVALLAKDHPLAAKPFVTAGDCAEHGHMGLGLDRGSRLGVLLRQAFEAANAPYRPAVEVRYCHSAAVLANAGLGIAIVDSYTPAMIAKMDLVVKPFTPSIQMNACLLTRKDTALPRLASDFVKEVSQVMDEHESQPAGVPLG
ncbi:LysR family transcriptional regulator [Roseovarius nubinhibens]|jgi:DNA-binding transcriptional LysR family regulator|uniref:Transcriptional regulator n=1 Tax=Roseovarius nubinhibens TaxID=314263 RepID=A0A348WFF1_9RHOB|nr:LysR substrate-binding domain-containing protein [Roseovarius nubinhibens]MBU2998539.1 LysR family transcriptional regulator [Roseovarius nubinhibens]HAR53263.1 transcriptional regulator [Roseovarius nubinhibens]